jgi:hypothetical protein
MPPGQPPFPEHPPGVPRMTHLPSVEAGLRYWRAIHRHAPGGSPAQRTAETMVAIYEAARDAILLGDDAGG